MILEKLFELATPYLEKNDFGVAHTRRVFEIAKENFSIPENLKEITLAGIILHDIGGSTIKEQYEKGPEIARNLLFQLGYGSDFIQEVCRIIRAHHDHPKNPSLSFKILCDFDRLVMLSPEEFLHYNARRGFDWSAVIDSMYTEDSKILAERSLERRKERAEVEYQI